MYFASGSAAGAGAGSGLIILLIFGTALYLLPSIIAISRRPPNWGSAVALNIFLGWFLLIPWVIAFMMAVRSKYQTVVTPYGQSGYGPPPSA